MEKKEDKLLVSSIGKTISVYYNDTYNSVSFKTGKFIDFDRQNLLILEEGKQNATLIPRNKCIRIELKEEQHAQAQTG